MLIKQLTNRSFFYRYLLTFILLLLIPLILFSFLIKSRIFCVLQEELLQDNLNNLKTTASTFENDLNSMGQIQNQVILSPIFSREKTTNDVSILKECINTLSTYTVINNAFEKIMITWENIPIMYSSTGSSSLSLLNPSDPTYPNFADTSALTISSHSHLGSQALVFTYHISFQPNTPAAKLSFIVNEDRYHSSDSDPGYYYILFNGQPISDNSEFRLFDQLDVTAYTNLSAPITETTSLDGESVLLSAIPSAYSNITFLSIVPLKIALSTSNRLQQEFLALLIACFVLSIAVIWLSLKWNYLPLQTLLNSTRHWLNDNQTNLNEISSIQSAINNLSNRNQQLENNRKNTLTNKVLSNLLNGIYSPSQPIPEEALDTIHFHPEHSHYIVCLMRQHGQKKFPHSHEKLSQLVRTHFPCAIVEDSSNTTVSFLINYDPKKTDLTETLEQLHCSVTLSLGTVTISTGNPCTDIYDIPISYIEAVKSMDYRFIRGNGNLIPAWDIAMQEDWSEQYPRQELTKLNRMLSTRSITTPEQINRQLDSIINYIQTCEVPLFTAKSICFEIINGFFSSMSDDELSANKSCLIQLANYDTIEDLMANLRNICHNLFSMTEPQANNDHLELIQQIYLYIHANYTDCNFSLQEMADFFDMGMTNLSQYFKRQTGDTLINYYTGLRMEKAKELLSQTNYKIDEIAQMTGYLNTSSFIRRFRQYYGFSPRQYADNASH